MHALLRNLRAHLLKVFPRLRELAGDARLLSALLPGSGEAHVVIATKPVDGRLVRVRVPLDRERYLELEGQGLKARSEELDKRAGSLENVRRLVKEAHERGLLPAPALLARTTLRQTPSLFHLRYSDRLLGVVAWRVWRTAQMARDPAGAVPAGVTVAVVAVGVLGGFTTFSAFSLDVFAMLQRGDYAVAAAYIGCSVAGSVMLLIMGFWLTRVAA